LSVRAPCRPPPLPPSVCLAPTGPRLFPSSAQTPNLSARLACGFRPPIVEPAASPAHGPGPLLSICLRVPPPGHCSPNRPSPSASALVSAWLQHHSSLSPPAPSTLSPPFRPL